MAIEERDHPSTTDQDVVVGVRQKVEMGFKADIVGVKTSLDQMLNIVTIECVGPFKSSRDLNFSSSRSFDEISIITIDRSRSVCTCCCSSQYNSMYENKPDSTSSTLYYETIPSPPVPSFYKINRQKPVIVSLESDLPYQIPTSPILDSTIQPITPSFQRNFPIIPVAILGFFECLAGLIILTLEFIIFDIALGIWCGGVYALAGAAILVLVIVTDRERHQISTVLIFQLVALMFTITEILLHIDLYRKRCLTKPNEPTRELTFHCQIVLIQIAAASLVFLCTIIFSILYFRLTLLVLKQPHGTCDISNAIHLTTC